MKSTKAVRQESQDHKKWWQAKSMPSHATASGRFPRKLNSRAGRH